jgi:hypothetical protein
MATPTGRPGRPVPARHPLQGDGHRAQRRAGGHAPVDDDAVLPLGGHGQERGRHAAHARAHDTGPVARRRARPGPSPSPSGQPPARARMSCWRAPTTRRWSPRATKTNNCPPVRHPDRRQPLRRKHAAPARPGPARRFADHPSIPRVIPGFPQDSWPSGALRLVAQGARKRSRQQRPGGEQGDENEGQQSRGASTNPDRA